MSTEQTTKTKFLVKYYNGVPLPDGVIFKEENIKAAINYMSKDEDIVLCSYPKTGTTWMTYIVWHIMHKDEPCPSMWEMASKLVPMLEMTGPGAVEALEKPRFYKHHLPRSLVNINTKAKYIYVYRHPEDTVVSFYHFLRNMPEYTELEFDHLFDAFINGQTPYGDYFDHVLQYDDLRSSPNVLFVSYEVLKRDIRSEILRIAKFLGEKYGQSVEEDEAFLNKVIEMTSFDYMKKNAEDKGVRGGVENRHVQLFRKGVIGDGKNHLGDEQMQRLSSKMLEKMKGTIYADMWS